MKKKNASLGAQLNIFKSDHIKAFVARKKGDKLEITPVHVVFPLSCPAVHIDSEGFLICTVDLKNPIYCVPKNCVRLAQGGDFHGKQ